MYNLNKALCDTPADKLMYPFKKQENMCMSMQNKDECSGKQTAGD